VRFIFASTGIVSLLAIMSSLLVTKAKAGFEPSRAATRRDACLRGSADAI
jgi:hypothetical protein